VPRPTEAVRLRLFRADGSVLVHDDAGGYKPLNRGSTVPRLPDTEAERPCLPTV